MVEDCICGSPLFFTPIFLLFFASAILLPAALARAFLPRFATQACQNSPELGGGRFA